MTKTAKFVVGALALALVGTAVGLAVPLWMAEKKTGATEDRLNAVYEKSYREAEEGLRDVETKLAKVNAVTGASVRRELLADVWKSCDVVVSDLAQLGAESEETEKVLKFLNQVGDYAYYLMGKVSAGESLTQEEKTNVRTFRQLVARLREEWATAGEGMTEGDRVSAATLADLSAVSGAIKSYSTVDYPELIYDGPFSDGLNDRETKFLQGKEEITIERAKERIRETFGAEDAEAVGEGNATVPFYVLSFTKAGVEYCAFVTKTGGYIASFNAYGETDDPTLTEEACVEKAKAFLIRAGYENMTCVWTCDDDSTLYLNFAYEENDVVFYPDLVKVKVSLNDGTILGADATEYLYNHTTRAIDYDRGAASAIRTPEGFGVLSTRDCVVPTEWNEEVFCREVKGSYDGMTYYLYFDLATGEEIRALVVVEENGEKLQ